MQDPVVVQARLQISRDRRGDSCRGPAFPDRSDAWALLDPAGEPDQRIPEVAFQLLSRRIAVRYGQEVSRSHLSLLFGLMTGEARFAAGHPKVNEVGASVWRAL